MAGEVKDICVDVKGERVLVTEAGGKFKVFTHPQGQLQYDMSTPIKVVLVSGFVGGR